MGEDKVRRIFQEALKIWSDVTPLTFTEVRSGKSDIRIDFTRLKEQKQVLVIPIVSGTVSRP